MLDDFIENHKAITIKNVYLKIYEDFWFKNFQIVCAYFHQQLNELFSFMNNKSRINNHYNASESRDLLIIIDEFKTFLTATQDTEYKIILEKAYIDKIKESKTFLKTSWGSTIPDNYKEFEVIKFKPILHFEKLPSTWDVIKEKQVMTEANFDNSVISIVLKEEVFAHIKELLKWWHYFNAVEESYKIVRGKLKSITWKEKAHEWFKADNYEIIFWHNPVDDAENDFFEWVKFLHMAIQNLRNEKAHTPAKDIDKNLAIHYIVLASLAYDLIDK